MGKKMKRFAEDMLGAIAAFGIGACLTTLGYALLSGTSLKSDDSYVLGLAAGIIVAPISFVTRVCDRVWRKKVALWVFVGFYLLLGVYAVFVFATAELHGPAVALLIFSAAVIGGVFDFAVLRRLRPLYVNSVGGGLAAVFIALLFAVQW